MFCKSFFGRGLKPPTNATAAANASSLTRPGARAAGAFLRFHKNHFRIRPIGGDESLLTLDTSWGCHGPDETRFQLWGERAGATVDAGQPGHASP